MPDSAHTSASPESPQDFSLVLGGPMYLFWQRAHLSGAALELLVRRIVACLLLFWVPLLALSALEGHLSQGVGVPFLFDLGAQARILIGIPLLLIAEVVAQKRIPAIVQQFSARGLIAPEDQPRFDGFTASAMCLRNSAIVEAVVLVVALVGGYAAGKRYLHSSVSTWYLTLNGENSTMTMAGRWYVWVSLTLFRFLLIRWYFRIFLWMRFLWQVASKIRLRMNALHPDKTGGLGFLSVSIRAFQPVLMLHTVILSAFIGAKIWHEGATLPEFKMEMVAWVVGLVAVALLPLTFFAAQLAVVRRTGMWEYAVVGSRYVSEFRRKWIEGKAPESEPLVGSGDIQSLADLGNSFENVKAMQSVPFDRRTIMQLAMMIALPFAPLALTMIPLEQLVDRLIGMIF